MSLSGQFFVKNGEKVLLLAPVLLLLLPNSEHCSEKKLNTLIPSNFAHVLFLHLSYFVHARIIFVHRQNLHFCVGLNYD